MVMVIYINVPIVGVCTHSGTGRFFQGSRYENILRSVLEEADIPKKERGDGSHYVYVIRLSGNPKNSVYVGTTGHHPYHRYLNLEKLQGQ